MTEQDSDIDITSIDRQIQLLFENQEKKLPEHKERLKELKKTFKNEELSLYSKNEIRKSIQELKDIIDKLESKQDYNFYVIESAELLQKYNNILKIPLKISFMGNVKEESKEKDEKNEIIKKYIEIARKYIKVDFKTEKKKDEIICENCGNKTDFIQDEGSYICESCSVQQESQQYTTTYRDSDRVNISTKYTYDRKVHFRDGMNQYQGKQNCHIEQDIYTQLEDIMDRHHLLEENKDKLIRYRKVTKEHVLMFLKELGFPKHYENVTLIHYTLTGKKPDDISYLEDKLLADFDLLVETYDKHFKNKLDRVNFISTPYVLYQLLQRHKHPCKKEDFVILKTINCKSFLDDICCELFSLLGWNFYPFY